MRDDTSIRRDGPAQDGQDRDGGRLSIDRGGDGDASEPCDAAPPRVVVDELAHLIDGLDAVQVTVPLRVAPREEAVAAEDKAVAAGLPGHGLPQHQRELESGPLPRHPQNPPPVSPVELVELLAAVRAGGQRNRPVGMQVIDVVERQERMERRVD